MERDPSQSAPDAPYTVGQKHTGGRPPIYEHGHAEQAKKLCGLGATDQEIADFFDVDVRTIYRWKHEHDEFCQALIDGKSACDDRVERSLYQRAIGYEQEEVKIFMPSGALLPVYAPFRAKIIADVGAAKLWLTNRRGEVWREKVETAVNVTIEKTVRTIIDPAHVNG